MGRLLKAYELIKAFSENNDIATVNALRIEDKIKLNCKTNISVAIAVSKSSIYQCNGLLRYNRNSLAQSSCSLGFTAYLVYLLRLTALLTSWPLFKDCR